MYAQSPTLGFPVAGENPYTAPIVSVLDHSVHYFYDPDWAEVLAYTGEMGTGVPGSTTPYGYKNRAFSAFIVNGTYTGSPPDGVSVLNYRGHSGYDYGYGPTTTILAAQEGTLYIPAADTVNIWDGSDPWCKYHTFYIDHGCSPKWFPSCRDGWTTWYLHASDLTVGTPHACTNGVGSNITSDEYIRYVHKGDPVAHVGTYGVAGYHLHFEVRRGCDRSTGSMRSCKVVDPYGWEWPSGDPIQDNVCEANPALHCATPQTTPLWNLSDWGVLQPIVSSVALTPSSGGYTATISGQNFDPSALVTLWGFQGQYFVGYCAPDSKICTPTSNTDTQIVVQISNPPVFNPGAFVLKVKNPHGPRSVGTVLAVSGATTSSLLTLAGQPADGGGTFVTFLGFFSLTNRGDGVFGAGVDTNGDGVSDVYADFKLSGEQITKVSVPGFGAISSTVSHVRINGRADLAFGDISGAYGGQPAGIYLQKSGSPTAKVVAWGDPCAYPCPIPGSQTYYSIYGPLALSDSGDVTFSSSLLDTQSHIASCCFLFRYSGSDGSISKVASDGPTGDVTPVGGYFVSGNLQGGINQITSDGDVVFFSHVAGGTSQGGIFRWSRLTQTLSKVVVQGDAVPVSGGGTFGFPLFGGTGSVSGRQLVFHGPIVGGTTRQVIVAVKDVRQSSPDSMTVVAYEGESTGTIVGGTLDSGTGLPFGGYGQNTAPPCIRADGGVAFHSLLNNAQINGTPTGQGVFLWDRKGFQKVAVDGDLDPSGKTIQGVFGTNVNDVGEVWYFVASLQ
jgi:hypothetical protein